jgi:flagellar biosynthesis chaperone FliJ
MASRKPDTALIVALEQRQRVLDEAQQVLSGCLRTVTEQAQRVAHAEARVHLVLSQIEAAQRPAPGVPLAVAVLGDLERLLAWCEQHVRVERERLQAVQAEADQARGGVATAHQGVRALQLVLEARAAERAERLRRAEIRDADETAARVHSRRPVSVA